MGSSKSPKPADTKGAAQAEAQGNKEVAQYTGALDRPTQIDPYGTLTWEFGPDSKVVTLTKEQQDRQKVLEANAQYARDILAGKGPADKVAWAQGGKGRAFYQKSLDDLASFNSSTGIGGSRDQPQPGDWIQRLVLSPEQQAILNAEQANDLALQQLASQGVNIAKGTLGTEFNPNLTALGSLSALGHPGQSGQPAPGTRGGRTLGRFEQREQFGQFSGIPQFGQSDQVLQGFQGSQMGLPQLAASKLGLQEYAGSSVPLSSLALQARQTGLPQNRLAGMQGLSEEAGQFSAERQQAIDAMYEQMTRFSGERFGREEEAERTRLANTGLMPGSEAYNRALSEFRRAKDESYRSAELQSILAGGQEQSRMRQDLLGTRASNIGLGQAQFGQDQARTQLDLAERQARQAAQAQMYGIGQGERQAAFQNALQQYGMGLTERQAQQAADAQAYGLGLDERQTAFQSALQQYGMGLDERQAQFGAGVNAYQLGLGERQAQQQSQMNQLTWDAQKRQQQFQEAAYKRALPLNEITALMGGSGVTLPQFQPFNQQQGWQGPQLLDAELARAGQDQASANAANARRGQTTAAIGTVALTAAMMF